MAIKEDYIKLGSAAEDLFIEVFCETFGPEKANSIVIQHPFVDIYGKNRFIDFALLCDGKKVAVEIDGETYHNPNKVSNEKYYDDLLKQNSLIYENWKVYRWTYGQLKDHKERVKDQLLTFLGELPTFKEIEDFLPKQKGKILELKEHQKQALDNLKAMRENGESIALLYHATGTGKTVTAVEDAKGVNKRTFFIAHTDELINQAENTFKSLWNDKSCGVFKGDRKEKDAFILCATIQSMNANLKDFSPEDFKYIIIDEAHHGAAETYKKLLSYFKPEFTLGLTATPERADGESILELFKNVAHKLDLKTAVELGELVPIRCIRVKTNVDLQSVRINGIKYNSSDLESKLYVPDRNNLIVDTYLEYVKNKKIVVFSTLLKHAEEIADIFNPKYVYDIWIYENKYTKGKTNYRPSKNNIGAIRNS
ncbi:DEAD/DEAH box helicase family protein [Clostridium sp. BSD9I1]|uniref:DEAD/DEAH box helicase family protein n=1 Tax=Clostridium sp. BSD9I1 TaxID=2003589 RepID=UPI0016456F96|nr:DEAD/DEAH box helicase family protein [Clostridium sp. BSD9I1]